MKGVPVPEHMRRRLPVAQPRRDQLWALTHAAAAELPLLIRHRDLTRLRAVIGYLALHTVALSRLRKNGGDDRPETRRVARGLMQALWTWHLWHERENRHLVKRRLRRAA